MMKHLILYDGTCGMCHRVVQWVLRHDKKGIFIFAPLQEYPNPSGDPLEDSVILLENWRAENERKWVFAKAAFRILWLTGGVWTLIGWKWVLPSWLIDPLYRFVAKRRKVWFPEQDCLIPNEVDKKRFLDPASFKEKS